jgi:hypothetical protein
MKKKQASIVAWALLGALVTVIVVAGWKLYALHANAIDLTKIPVTDLLFRIMELHWHALYGLLGGALIGLLEWFFWFLRGRGLRGESITVAPPSDDDPAAILRGMRNARADEYLNIREQARQAAEAGLEPPVENVVTARNGRFSYRVMGYRPLTVVEAQKAVREALEQDVIEEPEAGKSTTLLTDIGK